MESAVHQLFLILLLNGILLEIDLGQIPLERFADFDKLTTRRQSNENHFRRNHVWIIEHQ
jgi:hypothetical protein